MDGSLGCQKVVEDLAGNNQQLCAQYKEIAHWFPSVQMMRNHGRGLVKVMTAAEKQRAFPAGFNILPLTVLVQAMRETALPDPRQRARWWMLDSDFDDDTSDDSGDEVEELVILSDEVEEESNVQLLAPVIDAMEGDKNRPIDVEKLSEVADLPEVVVVKQDVEEDVGAPGKKKRDAEKKTAVRRSERVKVLKKEE
ncbi:hypothetical protein ZWY2020_014599 [Hordeum vulgare]|nr:hypothetical protein ZWY2020_014599 [Hordeum vulgare]